MNKCFVACMNKNVSEILKGVSRLYAYPSIPETNVTNEFVILDSGAFSLSQKGKEIDAEYMFKLSNYYKKYTASNQFPILAIAPDKFLDPFMTMQNYEFWMKYIKHPVVPVIQFTKNKNIDLKLALNQVDYYIKGNRIMAISNPSLTANESESLKYVIDYMRKLGVEWIHCLGAGWNTKDCEDWFKIGFDSIDSISYYTDAERKKQWKPFSYDVSRSNLTYDQLIINNYNLANSYVRTN